MCSSSGVAGTFIAGEVAPRDLDLVTVDSVVARMPQFHLAQPCVAKEWHVEAERQDGGAEPRTYRRIARHPRGTV